MLELITRINPIGLIVPQDEQKVSDWSKNNLKWINLHCCYPLKKLQSLRYAYQFAVSIKYVKNCSYRTYGDSISWKLEIVSVVNYHSYEGTGCQFAVLQQ